MKATRREFGKGFLAAAASVLSVKTLSSNVDGDVLQGTEEHVAKDTGHTEWRELPRERLGIVLLDGSLKEIESGNGYMAGGIALNPRHDVAICIIDGKLGFRFPNVAWTAIGGPIPANGEPISRLGLMDRNTGQVVVVWEGDIGTGIFEDGMTLHFENIDVRCDFQEELMGWL